VTAPVRTYYGRPVVRPPVWKWMVPAYFWAGGTAGASATLALAARLAGNPRLARSALVTAAAGVAVTPPLLVADLGRPGRALNMMRVAKVTSPMSVGTWVLAGFCPAVAVAATAELSGRLARLGRAAEVVAACLGPVMATYTAVLVADTAIPAVVRGPSGAALRLRRQRRRRRCCRGGPHAGGRRRPRPPPPRPGGGRRAIPGRGGGVGRRWA